tara:strand:+ start:1626 stop:1901 length:276 start_codon:yes stop_codon:yes gene_type:complete
MKMPIYLNKLTYEIRKYTKRKNIITLSDKVNTNTSDEICLGNTVEILNNPIYNSYTLNKLNVKNTKGLGCEIKIVEVKTLTQHGFTNDRFI